MISRLRGPRRFLIYLRFARFLLGEFRWPLGVFTSLVLAGGMVLHFCYHREALRYAEACYAVFLMIFMQPMLKFPDEWYLQPFFFLVPLIGLGALADSVMRLAFLMFTSKQRLPEWQRMVASLYRDHLVVVGVGKVGFRIIQGLIERGESVVAIELKESSPLIDETCDLGVPIVRGSGRNPKTLEQAGVPLARAVILATSDDLANLDSALAARDLNPKARVVLRLFDESLAAKVEGAFAMPAISTSQVAAPAFIAAATGRKIYQGFQLADMLVHMTDIAIAPGGGLLGATVGAVQKAFDVNIVMYQGPQGVNINPTHDLMLGPGDTILVIAPMDRLVTLEERNQPGRSRERLTVPAPTSVRPPG